MKKQQKKKFNMVYVYIGIIVILFGSIFVLNNAEKDNVLYGMPVSKLNPATKAQLDDPNYQNIILPKQLDKKVSDKEDFFVYMFSSTCGACKASTPLIKPIVDELGIDFPMLNIQEFNDSGIKYGVEYTPTIIYFKDGVETARLQEGVRLDGMTSGSTLEEIRAFFVEHSKTEVK
ncbi:thioredoxin family protein [Paenibacillus sp. GSMTC-2017]|uniref:thioredoxin family protein n=1 Tax=Paenibacillus sp. GSMTC-2017 TaxID=2794350 RepID=UPI0018D81CF8|nr:thioredoxin family protein [Paenibacillus sp. GSMTC-2017]MBH5318184.1 thioredoxin family protein [Paenibacillus sp. GSMTC-2017]